MRIFLTTAVIVSLTAPLAAKPAQEPKTPTYEAVEHASDICSTTGAFGRKFGRTGSGRVDTTVGEDWAPFTKLTIMPGEIHAEASFRGVGDSQEEDEAAAKKFRTALDKALTASHVLAHRKAHSNGAEFESHEDGSGIAFLLRQDEEHITADCIDRVR
jgi:hypothetical protein